MRSGMNETELWKKLSAHLSSTGRTKLLPLIQSELAKLQAYEERLAPQLEVATEAEAQTAQMYAKQHGIEATVHTNDNLITGWRLRTREALTDRSGKRALTDLYRRITT